MLTPEEIARLEAIGVAPALEALFDVQVDSPAFASPEHLNALAMRVKDEYPVSQPLWKQSFTLTVGTGPVDTPAPALQGYRCTSKDEKQIVQFRVDGFTFSRLRPYTRWEVLYPQVQKLWALYRDAVQPKLVTRVATRFINVIEVPAQKVPLGDYFTAPPAIPIGLPSDLDEFLYRVVFKFPDNSVTAIITQASHPSARPDATSLLLDIDVFCLVSYGPMEPRLEETFDRLHGLKNLIFVRYTQPKIGELFK
jgi:uncharacterized protein (TIGR04255 family)